MSLSDNEDANSHLSKRANLIVTQYERLHKLKQILANFKKDSAARKTKPYFSQRLLKLNQLSTDFARNHDSIRCLSSDRQDKYFKEDVANQFDEAHLDAVCLISDAMEIAFPVVSFASNDQTHAAVPNSVHSSTAAVKLPKLPVPRFRGKFTDWPAFHDAFTRLIHSERNFSSVQKFHFLKEALPPLADLDVHQMDLTDSNYTTAWDLILKRYNNPHLLFLHHMNALYAIPVLDKEKAEELKSLVNVAKVTINEFKRLKIPIESCNHWIAHLLSTKLPIETLKVYEVHLGGTADIPTFEILEEFVNNRLVGISILENRNSHSENQNVRPTQNNRSSQVRTSGTQRASHTKRTFHTTAATTNAPRCIHCGESHILRRCHKFLASDCLARRAIVKKANVCFNCLSAAHRVSQCMSSKNCLQCGQRHHTLLHSSTQLGEQTIGSPSISQDTTQLSVKSPLFQPAQSTTSAHTSHSNLRQNGAPSILASNSTQLSPACIGRSSKRMLLATAMVQIYNPSNQQSVMVRALIDQGSEATIISEHVVQSLQLTRRKTHATITGVGARSNNNCRFTVDFCLYSRVHSEFSINVETAYVLPTLTSQIPSDVITPAVWPHLQGLQLADPSFHQSRRIDLILGVDVFARIILPDLRIGNPDEPVAQKTHLGWIISGSTTSTANSSTIVNTHHAMVELDSLVQRFFELEQVPQTRVWSEEEQWVENFFTQTHHREPSGKYVVRLPHKSIVDPNQGLGKSKQIAMSRFHSLERKLERSPELQKRYHDCIEDYFALGQIKLASTTEEQHTTISSSGMRKITACVLPHHAVFKEESVSTKLRVVFDASCKTSNGRSLNDLLYIGPPLQNDLVAVLLNWRTHQFVFAADIQKMYRCIRMHEEDTHYQRILFRDNSAAIKEYCLTTVTFGTASAPFTAIRVMHQLAHDEEHRYPLAKDVILKDVYVDDILTGSSTESSALLITNDLINALQSAGMELRKWTANSPQLINDLPTTHISNALFMEFNTTDFVKTLGITWQRIRDIFQFSLNFEICERPTKRILLSTVARLFDPMGFIAPTIITAKIILKKVWSRQVPRADGSDTAIGWDEELPEDLQELWVTFATELHTIKTIEVPRWIQYQPTAYKTIQLHAFCDGSSNAYAASIYIRIEQLNGRIVTKLLVSKSKVTPTKPLTIPRTELCGAMLATKLMFWVQRNLRVASEAVSVYYWTDATIVLYWINGDPARWKTFVANRVATILEVSKPHQWNHVKTQDNPADCATRGLNPTQLKNFALWWEGPNWLALPSQSWPQFDANTLKADPENSELKPNPVIVHVATTEDSIIQRFSSYTKTLFVCAYILRFCFNCKIHTPELRKTGSITPQELTAALHVVVRQVQREAFNNEIATIAAEKSLSKNSKLISVSPFLDTDQILRVRGRLRHANLSYAQKHPIILPQNHPFTDLVIHNAHKATLHGGTQLTLATTRQQYWILSGGRAVKRALRSCITCFRNQPQLSQQIMGDLPLHRVCPPQRPFITVGIDYTGALEVKASRYRGHTKYKAYIAVLICLATKAIHLEAVTGLSTDHFLWALQRFIGRRGLCTDIYSDNGTNFVGADNALRTTWKQGVQQDIEPHLSINGVKWHFSPPSSPNFGGLWEANIKSLKHHLKRAAGSSLMTYEQLSTLLVRIEASLNSRPLCPLTADVEDLSALTPAHFLIGSSLLAAPDTKPTENSLKEQFCSLQRTFQQFWRQWRSDWLSHLQTRPKWRTQHDNLQLNDLVVFRNDHAPPNQWA